MGLGGGVGGGLSDARNKREWNILKRRHKPRRGKNASSLLSEKFSIGLKTAYI